MNLSAAALEESIDAETVPLAPVVAPCDLVDARFGIESNGGALAATRANRREGARGSLVGLGLWAARQNVLSIDRVQKEGAPPPPVSG